MFRDILRKKMLCFCGGRSHFYICYYDFLRPIEKRQYSDSRPKHIDYTYTKTYQ